VGNGVVTPRELCDDGNPVDGDGCEASCTPTLCVGGLEMREPSLVIENLSGVPGDERLVFRGTLVVPAGALGGWDAVARGVQVWVGDLGVPGGTLVEMTYWTNPVPPLGAALAFEAPRDGWRVCGRGPGVHLPARGTGQGGVELPRHARGWHGGRAARRQAHAPRRGRLRGGAAEHGARHAGRPARGHDRARGERGGRPRRPLRDAHLHELRARAGRALFVAGRRAQPRGSPSACCASRLRSTSDVPEEIVTERE
jgi:cysteine-rich repeat protein